jgi:lipooligosaccharide transport system permease protein
MAHPTMAVFEYHLAGYRRVWRGSIFSSFAMPVLLFLGMGLGVGEYVDRGGDLTMPYADFIGAGLLAVTGLMVGMIEAGFPVLGGFTWHRTYFGMAATPARVGDMVGGQLGYIGARILVTAGAFLVVMLPFGAVESPWAVAAPAVAVLLGLAVAAPMFALSASVRDPNSMALAFRFGLLPMMLFSGVLFPVEQLPDVLRPLAYATPVWHAVELCRAAVLGLAPSWPVAAHLAYLGLWVVVGYLLASMRFRARLAR